MGIRSDGSCDWRCLRGGQRALIHELALRGVSAKAQVSFPISYKGKYLGEYAADLVVGEKVIVELKCVDRFANEHLA
jgi:GxxExxY protein